MRRMIQILPAIILICSLSAISGCDKSENLSENKVAAVKQAPLVEITPPSDTNPSGVIVSPNETDISEIIENEDTPIAIDD